MIATALRSEIEQLAHALRGRSPLFLRAREGSLGPEHLARYLANVHALVQQTPVHLELARRAAKDRGLDALAAHFADKQMEEAGHDAWAARDLASVTALSAGLRHPQVLGSMRALITSITEIIEADPRHYLAYILVAEYVTVLLGPEWLELLEDRCGIPRTAMTVVGNHAELDRDHTEEAFDRIDELVGDPRQLPLMREVARRSMAHLDTFLCDVVAVTDTELAEGHVHAPAA